MKKQKTVSYWQFVLLAHLSALFAFAIIRGIQLVYSSVSLKDNIWNVSDVGLFMTIIVHFWLLSR